jgi:glutathione synthase/RimK-type ligase-like ATP-grasp enzyme
MRTFIYSYKFGSKSAKEFAKAMGIKRIKHRNSKFRGHKNKIVINWGSGNLHERVKRCHVINIDTNTVLASNKLRWFRKASTVPGLQTPEWTKNRAVAQSWSDLGHVVVVRHVLNGNSGKGIEIVEAKGQVPWAPLYTKYIPKKEEYRIHVMNGQVIDGVRKARRLARDRENVDYRIRNVDRGFVFARAGMENCPECVYEQAKLAVNGLGLDFGAADVIYNQKQDKAYVIEVNTAPGIVGTTIERYKENMKNFIRENFE